MINRRIGSIVGPLLRYAAPWSVLFFGSAAFAEAPTDSGSAVQLAESDMPRASNPDNAGKSDLDEIVITGTLIRDSAPTGSQVLQLSNDQIATLGAVDTSQLLGSIPQDQSFNNRPQVGSYGQYQTINHPILRYLGGNSSGGSSTLLLLDGERMPGMGIYQTSPDMDAIAPGAIDRIEMVTGGGSSIYGADAVGGVVNLITRKRFDGLEFGGHYGGANSYGQWDATATAGHSWSSGSIWLSYDHAHDDLLNSSARSYIRDYDYVNKLPLDLQCSPGNLVQPISATQSLIFPIVNGAPSAAPGLGNRCDNAKASTYFPSQTRNSVLAGLNVDLTDSMTFDLRAYFMDRTSEQGSNTTALYNVVINPVFFTSAQGSLASAFGGRVYATTKLDTFGVTPRITLKLGHDWQMVAFLNYGDSLAKFTTPGLDPTALQSEVFTGGFDPIAGNFPNTPAGQAASAYQTNFLSYSTGRDSMSNGRVVFDGPLFALPGGDIRAGVGSEYVRENFTLRTGTAEASDLGSILSHSNSRTISAAFGELSVPIIGESNRLPAFYLVSLSASGRYDHYSDFGGTFNPKIGMQWQPTSEWTLRGNWSKAFQAPSLAELVGANLAQLNVVPASYFPNPADTGTAGLTSLILYPGGGSNLQPEKARSWEVGTDFKPEVIPGLSAGMTYYKIDFTGRIGAAPFYNSALYFSQFPNNFIMHPTAAQIQAFANLSATPGNAASFVASPGSVYALMDARDQNLSSVDTSGLDFNVHMTHPTDLGSVFGGVDGNYILTYDQQSYPGGPISSVKANQISQLHMAVSAGARIGPVLGQATWQYTEGFPVPPTVANLEQSHVSSFGVVNLAFQYNPAGEGLWKDSSVNLNIDNLLDTNPPVYNGNLTSNTPGYFGFTLGRFIQLGFKKKF